MPPAACGSMKSSTSNTSEAVLPGKAAARVFGLRRIALTLCAECAGRDFGLAGGSVVRQDQPDIFCRSVEHQYGADDLDRRGIEPGAQILQQRSPVCLPDAGRLDLDEFMVFQIPLQFPEHRRRQAGLAYPDHGIQVMGAGLEETALGGGEGGHDGHG